MTNQGQESSSLKPTETKRKAWNISYCRDLRRKPPWKKITTHSNGCTWAVTGKMITITTYLYFVMNRFLHKVFTDT